LEIVTGTQRQAIEFLTDHPDTEVRFQRVCDLVSGFWPQFTGCIPASSPTAWMTWYSKPTNGIPANGSSPLARSSWLATFWPSRGGSSLLLDVHLIAGLRGRSLLQAPSMMPERGAIPAACLW
jgi:hypothetical protein